MTKNILKLLLFWFNYFPRLLVLEWTTINRIVRFHTIIRLSNYFSDKSKNTLFETGRQVINALNLHKSANLNSDSSALYRQNETLYILGSGPSINELQVSHLRQIKNSDSIAFNYFLVHDFVPTFYILQPPQIRNSNLETYGSHQMSLILRRKSYEYSAVKVIIKGGFLTNYSSSSVDYLCWLKQSLNPKTALIVTPRLNVGFRSAEALKDFLYVAKKSNILGFNTGLMYPILQVNGTLNFCMTLAAQLGYKKLVLCGFDSQNPGHFYDRTEYKRNFPELNKRQENNQKLKMKIQDNNMVHGTMLSHNGFISPNESTKVICEFLINEFNMDIEVQGESSYFSGFLPKHRWS